MNASLVKCLAIGGAGSIGALTRYGVIRLLARWIDGNNIHWATLIINVTGSAFLGWFYAYVAKHMSGPTADTLKLAIATGFVGAYTTFSTYMFETDSLVGRGSFYQAGGYFFGSLILGLIGVRLGVVIGGVQEKRIEAPDMSLQGEQVLLRVYLRNADRAPHTPTWERIVKAARKQGLYGATVLQGILGFGSHGLLKDSTWSLTEKVPIIVEIVDSAESIAAFLAGPLNELMINGMVTLERAAVMMYRHGKQDSAPPLRLAALLHPLSTVPKLQPGANMTINENGVLLRVFIGESDAFEGHALHEAIVQKARALGLSGATVLRGIEGFGGHSVVHKSSMLELSADLPIVIEIVDTEDKVRLFLPDLEKMVGEGMITMEYVAILLYRHGEAKV